MSVDTYYPLTPFDGQDTWEAQPYYYPDLREKFIAHSTYANLATIVRISPEMGRTQITTDMIAPEAEHEPSDERIMWRDPVYFDTFERRTSVQTFTGKIAFHEADEMFLAFKRGGSRGLLPIVRGELGQLMITQMNKRAKVVYLSAPTNNVSYGAGAVSNFAEITTSHLMSVDYLDGVWGWMAEQGYPYQVDPTSLAEPNMFAMVSPGVLNDLKRDLQNYSNRPIIDVRQYASMGIIPYKNEVFSHNNIRFIAEPLSILWNAGEIFQQTTITAPLVEGAGAPDPLTTPVNAVYYMGQKQMPVNHYIQVANVTGFSIGDFVTIHTHRMPSVNTPAYGVANGVDWRNSKSVQRRIVAIDAVNKRITVDKPMMRPYSTDLGSGVYGYITKGRHIHSVLTVNKGLGVRMIVHTPNKVLEPKPFDDYETMYRVTWKGHWDFNVWQPETFHVGFFAGTNYSGSTLGYIS